MSEPQQDLPIVGVFRSASGDFARNWLLLAGCAVLFKLVVTWMFAPAITWLLTAVLARSGQQAISNHDIAHFLLTPTGIVYAILFATTALALILVAHAGTMVFVTARNAGLFQSARQMVLVLVNKIGRILQLGAIQVVLVGLSLLPLALLALLTCGFFLTEHDINYYLDDRPTEFYVAVVLVVILLVLGTAVGLFLYVRWSLALPILLFEHQHSISALRISRDRVRGAGWKIAGILLGWQFGWLLVGLLVTLTFRVVAGEILALTGQRSSVLIPLLAVRALLFAALSFVAIVGQALLIRRIYRSRTPEAECDAPIEPETPTPRSRRILIATAVLLFVVPLGLWASVPMAPSRTRVLITAHRAGAWHAPENTLAALRLAIEHGADYAEIDVQETSDGVVILLHDNDLKRIAGVSKRVDQVTYKEIRKLDAGKSFGAAFVGEPIPTLREYIATARGKIRLNIELKFVGANRNLAVTVANLIREEKFEPECIVTSLDYGGLMVAKRHDPELRTGLVVAQALGDMTRFDVDVLSVRARFLTEEGLRAIRRTGKEVHIWTINDPRQMALHIRRGVDNIITDDPETLHRIREEWEALSPPEQFVLASRALLGLGN